MPHYSLHHAKGELEQRCIDGWLTVPEQEWLYSAASVSKVIIEIGCYKGRSTLMLCSGTSGVVFTIDPWKPEPVGAESGHYMDLISHTQRQKVIDDVKMKLGDFLDEGKLFLIEGSSNFSWHTCVLLAQHRPVDMVFIDGDHSKLQVEQDIANYRRLVRPGGLICGHDYKHEMPGLCQAVDHFYPRRGLVPHTSLWWARKE